MIQSILRAIIYIVVALLGLIMATIFMVSTIIAMLILSIVSAIRGQRFEAKEYWTQRQERNKSMLNKGPLRQPAKADITDVEVREIHNDSGKPR